MKASERLDVTTEFNYVTSFYGDDFQKESLRVQLISFGIEFQRTFVQSEGKDKPTIFDLNFHFLIQCPEKTSNSSLHFAQANPHYACYKCDF